MTESEVKKLVGKNWKEFCKWMYGQTCGVNKDGSTNYYECDVMSFVEHKKRSPKSSPPIYD